MLDFDFNSLAFPVSLPLSFSTSHVFCVLLCKSKKMEDYVVNTIIGAVIFWTTLLFMIRKMLPDRSYEFCNRLVSTTHATLGVTLAALSVQDWSSPVSPLASNSTPKQVPKKYSFFKAKNLLMWEYRRIISEPTCIFLLFKVLGFTWILNSWWNWMMGIGVCRWKHWQFQWVISYMIWFVPSLTKNQVLTTQFIIWSVLLDLRLA